MESCKSTCSPLSSTQRLHLKHLTASQRAVTSLLSNGLLLKLSITAALPDTEDLAAYSITCNVLNALCRELVPKLESAITLK